MKFVSNIFEQEVTETTEARRMERRKTPCESRRNSYLTIYLHFGRRVAVRDGRVARATQIEARHNLALLWHLV